jgi:hypothetical protein
VSFDVAVWEGGPPASDAEAVRTFDGLYARYVEGGRTAPRTRIRSYAEALLRRYPDLADETEDMTPWASAPLLYEASGPFMYFGMSARHPLAHEAWEYAVALAKARKLVLFDPQTGTLVTAPRRRPPRIRWWQVVLGVLMVWLLAGAILSHTTHSSPRRHVTPQERAAAEVEAVLVARAITDTELEATLRSCFGQAGYAGEPLDAVGHIVRGRQRALAQCLRAAGAVTEAQARRIVASAR